VAPAIRPSPMAVGALAALILVSTTFAYVLYFFLLKNIGPTRTASVTFLVPVFGSTWAIIFLHEPFSLSMLLGLAIILLSVGLVTGARFGRGAAAVPPVDA
ncbi:MAG TPA: DMT family transporter, partial [Promineifilum sp.]|nr:DMT family transporter [Promineifilum sp.]